MNRPAPLTKQEQAEVLAAAKRLEAAPATNRPSLDAYAERLRNGVRGLVREAPGAMHGALAVVLRELAKEVEGKRGG